MTETFQEMFARGDRAVAETNFAEARAVFLASVRRAAEETDRTALAEAFCGLARAEQGIGNLAAAQHHYGNAVLLYRKDGPKESLAEALRREADIARQAGLAEEAATLDAEADKSLLQQS